MSDDTQTNDTLKQVKEDKSLEPASSGTTMPKVKPAKTSTDNNSTGCYGINLMNSLSHQGIHAHEQPL